MQRDSLDFNLVKIYYTAVTHHNPSAYLHGRVAAEACSQALFVVAPILNFLLV